MMFKKVMARCTVWYSFGQEDNLLKNIFVLYMAFFEKAKFLLGGRTLDRVDEAL